MDLTMRIVKKNIGFECAVCLSVVVGLALRPGEVEGLAYTGRFLL
jgi:hypothetical protein